VFLATAGLFAIWAADVYILENFDDKAAPGIIAMTMGQLVDVDGNGDKEARFVTTNFSQIIRLNLFKAETKEGVALKELIRAFREGDGSNLRINITQQSSRDTTTDCLYDDIRSEKVDGGRRAGMGRLTRAPC
jgi:hypothetical protein